MGLLSTSLAMLNGAHLSILRKFERKFIRLATQKMESGLRNPSGEEIMMADRQLWSQISDLVNLHNWSLDHALTEFTDVRGDMASLLQPRMAPLKRIDPPAPPFRPGRGGKGKQKGGGKGRQQFGGQGQQGSPGGAKWVTKFEDKGKTRFLCRDFSSQKGCSFPDCKFEHLCPVPRPDGRPCLGNHPAFQHRSAAH